MLSNERNLARAAALGFTFYVGPEVEFFYFKDSEGNVVGLWQNAG